jgi:hypothetical protein
MRHAFVITKPGTAKQQLLKDLGALGCAKPQEGEVDLRGADVEKLLTEGRISASAYLTLTHGRCDDFGIPSPAGVGCYLSHIEACRHIAALPRGSLALVVEADCKLNVSVMKAALDSVEQALSLSSADPHVVMFGAHPMRGCTSSASELCDAKASVVCPLPGTGSVLNAVLPGGIVSLAHCCLYTVSGAAFVLSKLARLPVDVQWDSALSVLSALPTGCPRALLWWCPVGAHQLLHFSSIQDLCFSCMLQGALPATLLVGFVLLALVAGALIALRHRA